MSEGELTPKQLRRRNRALAKEGKRICRTHQGVALPLTDDYFYRTAHGSYFETECKACRKRRAAERVTERRHADAAFAEQTRTWKRNSHARNKDAVNRRRRLKRYRAAFRQVQEG